MESPVKIVAIFVQLICFIKSQKYLSQNGTASQSTTYVWTSGPLGADLAVTGGPTNDFNSRSCATTAVNQYTAWWMLAFPGNTIYFTNVKIFYRSNTPQRLAGYSLYVTNSSVTTNSPKPTNGHLCFHHTGTELPSVNQTVDCNVLGQYIVIYNERNRSPSNNTPGYSSIALLELCDVQIYGCYKGWWNSNCSTPCPVYCLGDHCYPGNGSCVWGCNQDNCLNDICDIDTGNCTQGCKIGLRGDYCDKACESGTFGQNCANTCHCINQSCDSITGVCPPGGCERGYKSSNCSIECSLGKYWYNCNQSCDGCLSDSCDKEDGNCTNKSGCKPGWQYIPSEHQKCDIACDDGYFGMNCTHQCYCRYGTCIKSRGKCLTEGCQHGWKGDTCSEECSLGKYSYNCNESCDGCLSDSCDKEDGDCTDKSGCKPGWQYIPSEHQKCDIACDDGYFGMNCTHQCYCRYGTCIKSRGECLTEGCQHGWKGDTCSEVNLPPSEPQTTNIGPIAGGIGGVAVVIMLVVILVIFIRRHRSHSKKSKYRESRHSTNTNNYENHYPNKDIGSLKGNKQLDGAVGSTKTTVHVKIAIPPSNQRVSYETSTQDHVYTNHVSDEEGGNDEFVYSNSEDITKYRIPLTELQNVINEKYRDDGFLKEYKILPHGLVHPHIEGSKEENKIKNRFLTTWPYDHSRVILQGNPSSDYINASYIDSYSREKAYIASQGPKKHTIKDFWQMVWQEKVDIIVMVTKLEEERRKKCEQYWPESTSKPFITGQFKVSLSQEREHTGHAYRVIRLLNTESKSERTVHHFHFTQWPDHGVPDKIKLVSFYRKVKSTTTSLNGPMVVHCSAGVGRTGTFIAIDALYEHGQKTGYIDIMEYVQMMRKDRMNMIQTKEQYIIVFEALLEAFTVPDTSIDKDHFCTYLENQQLNITPKNQTFQNLEFQKLKDTKPTYSDKSYNAAMSTENAAKNAVENILPHDKYRPFLMSYEKSRNDYINAVIIPGYIGTGEYLVTQYPLQDTVVDFWTMVYDTDSTVVVMLKSVDESVPLWPQKSDVFHFSKFNVSVKSDNTSFPLNLTLTHKDTNRNTTVRILSMDDWNAENIPSSGTCMLNLLNSASSWRKDHPGSVTVVCQDGCKRSGIFAALSLVLEKMELDDEVDILQVVRTIQVRRPEFFPSFNQYEYCYRCIKEHLEGNSLYANA